MILPSPLGIVGTGRYGQRHRDEEALRTSTPRLRALKSVQVYVEGIHKYSSIRKLESQVGLRNVQLF
jgi:hypothetical protein